MPCWRAVIAAPSLWPTGGYTSTFPILTMQVLEGRPPPEMVMGVLRDGAEALFAELGWPPAEG